MGAVFPINTVVLLQQTYAGVVLETLTLTIQVEALSLALPDTETLELCICDN
jgi:hypothetical protein